MSFPLFLALKYLKPKRSVTSVVTVFSVLGVLLGVAIIIIVRAIMTGFGDMWHHNLLSFKPHITISRVDSRAITNEDDLCERIANIPGVTAVSPAIETQVLLEHDRRVLAPVIIGVDAESAERMMPSLTIKDGDLDLEGDTILVGTDLAGKLGIMAGDRVLVYSPMNLINKDEIYFPEELTVAGIFSTGHYQFDSGVVVTSLAVGRDLMGLETGAYSIYVKTGLAKEYGRLDDLKKEIATRIGLFSYKLKTWLEADHDILNIIAVERNMMTLLLMFITIVAIFCITVTLIVITVQKTDEIGLLKALGFSSGQILMTFVLYGWIQCFAGIVLGVGTAFAILCNLQGVIDFLARCGVEVFPKSIYGLDTLPWRVVPLELVQVILMVFVFCTLFCALFAWRAARLDPVTALRKE